MQQPINYARMLTYNNVEVSKLDKKQKKIEIAKKQYKKLANRPLVKERKKAVNIATPYLIILMIVFLGILLFLTLN